MLLQQISFDDFDWSITYPKVSKLIRFEDPQKLPALKRELLVMLDHCDACPYRETRNDVRQDECWDCKQDFGWGRHRRAMEEKINNIEILQSMIRARKTRQKVH